MNSKNTFKKNILFVIIIFSGFLFSFINYKNPIIDDALKEKALKEYYSTQYKASSWYSEMKSSTPNFYEVRDEFNEYFKSNTFLVTQEIKQYKRFTHQYFPNIDAKGNYIDPSHLTNNYNSNKDINKSSASSVVGKAWKQIFLKWNTTQDNGGTGVLRSIRIDPSDNNTVLAGAATAGIWQTSDSGNNWSFVSGGVPEVEWVNEIIYSRKNPKIVYANTNMGVVKSIDGGKNWKYTALKKTFPDTFGSLLWLDLTGISSEIVYATTEEKGKFKILKSIDGGNSWKDKYQSNKRIWDMRVKLDDPNVVYILEESATTDWINFKKSTDGGITFHAVNNGYPADHSTKTHRGRIATTPANNNVVYVVIGYNGGDANDKISFFKSTDAGRSFIKKNNIDIKDPLVNAMGPKDFLSGTCHLAQLTWNLAFTVSETDENFIACAANKIKVSTDGGATWAFDLSGNIITGRQYDTYASNNAHTGVHGDHHALSIIGKNIWNANDGGAYHSKDGGFTVAKDKTDGLGIMELWGYSQSFKNDIMAVGLNHNQICFRDDAVYGGWIGVNGADAMATNINPIDDQYMYNHPWGHERVKRSLTGKKGHSFQELGIQLGYITLDNLEYHPNQFYTIYGSDYGDRNKTYQLSKTTDNASSWQVMNEFSADKANAVAVKVSFADPNYIYAVVEPNRVIKSIDEGKTWKDVNPPASLLKGFALWRLAVSDKNPNHLWVTVKANQDKVKVIHSKDGGITWNDFSTGLPQYAIYSMIYQRGSDDILYVGTRFGIYYRKASMNKWEQFGSAMPVANTSFMFINYAKGKLRVGTSRGLWENDLVELTPPKANATASKKIASTADPMIQFADYSVGDKNATYQWKFPGAMPATSTAERPLVSYEKARKGKYNVTLTIMDSRGKSTQTLKNFITKN